LNDAARVHHAARRRGGWCLAHRRKKDITGQDTINGTKASLMPKEMTAKARAVT
jgi:hypothetical protein